MKRAFFNHYCAVLFNKFIGDSKLEYIGKCAFASIYNIDIKKAVYSNDWKMGATFNLLKVEKDAELIFIDQFFFKGEGPFLKFS